MTKLKVMGRGPTTRTPPDWEDAYGRYRPLLLGALSKLAARGFAALPDDGLDLIHEFFVDSWHPIVERYDERIAKFETYLFACFVHFARPRIIRLARWRETLVSPDVFTEAAALGSWEATKEESHSDSYVIQVAMSHLPSPERHILLAFVAEDVASERELAQRFSVTRYRLRETLSDALGRLAVVLNEHQAFADPEWALLLELWHHGRTAKEAAGVLRLPISEVQSMRMRLFGRLVAAVKEPSRRQGMKKQIAMTEGLLEQVLGQEPSEDDFDALRRHKEFVLSFLVEHPSAEALIARYAEQLTPERLAKLYEILGSEESVDEEEAKLTEVFFRASEEDERAIGLAFAECLLPPLPYEMLRFSERIFLGSSRIDDNEYETLLRDVSVQSGGRYACELAHYGVTPVTVAAAAQGVANLARRFCEANDISRRGQMILDKAGSVRDTPLPMLGRGASVMEVILMAELDQNRAERLFDWLVRAAGWVPRLFNGFNAELWGDELRLERTDIIDDDLFARWGAPERRVAI